MDTQSITAFIEVADSQSFTKAADRLFLSQPAISKRIATLEQQLAQQLFDRLGGQVSLTDAGRALLPHARRILQEIEDAKRAISSLTDIISGHLSIGTSHHIGLHRLPSVLRRYTQDYPDVDLDIHFMDSEDACEAVLAGKLEMAIVTFPTQALPHLKMQLVWPDPLMVVCATQHPLTQLKNPQLRDLASHAAVLPDENTYTHRILKAALEKQGLVPQIRLATNYLETIKMLVSIGMGWSVLPNSMLDDTLKAIGIPQLQLHRDLGAVWHERRTLSSAAKALLKTLQDARTEQ